MDLGEAAALSLIHHHHKFMINSSTLPIRESSSEIYFLQADVGDKTAKSVKHSGKRSIFLSTNASGCK